VARRALELLRPQQPARYRKRCRAGRVDRTHEPLLGPRRLARGRL
jgi:hypothetical protein